MHGVHQSPELLETHLTALVTINKRCAPALAPLHIIQYNREPLEQLVVWKFTFCRLLLQCHQIFNVFKGGKRKTGSSKGIENVTEKLYVHMSCTVRLESL